MAAELDPNYKQTAPKERWDTWLRLIAGQGKTPEYNYWEHAARAVVDSRDQRNKFAQTQLARINYTDRELEVIRKSNDYTPHIQECSLRQQWQAHLTVAAHTWDKVHTAHTWLRNASYEAYAKSGFTEPTYKAIYASWQTCADNAGQEYTAILMAWQKHDKAFLIRHWCICNLAAPSDTKLILKVYWSSFDQRKYHQLVATSHFRPSAFS